jgi:hypothetical protein
MAQIVKTIKGYKYAYEVKLDPKRKKQIWTYRGKVEKRLNPEKMKGELYSAIMRHARDTKDGQGENHERYPGRFSKIWGLLVTFTNKFYKCDKVKIIKILNKELYCLRGQ